MPADMPVAGIYTLIKKTAENQGKSSKSGGQQNCWTVGISVTNPFALYIPC